MLLIILKEYVPKSEIMYTKEFKYFKEMYQKCISVVTKHSKNLYLQLERLQNLCMWTLKSLEKELKTTSAVKQVGVLNRNKQYVEIRDFPPTKGMLLPVSLDDARKDLKTNRNHMLNCTIKS